MLVGRGPGAASVFDRLIVVAGEDLLAPARAGASETELREIAVDDATWSIRKQHCGLDRLQPRRMAFGLEGRRVETVDDLGGALEKALTHGGPTVLELPVAITPPWEL